VAIYDVTNVLVNLEYRSTLIQTDPAASLNDLIGSIAFHGRGYAGYAINARPTLNQTQQFAVLACMIGVAVAPGYRTVWFEQVLRQNLSI
jgi:hypothetical protein